MSMLLPFAPPADEPWADASAMLFSALDLMEEDPVDEILAENPELWPEVLSWKTGVSKAGNRRLFDLLRACNKGLYEDPPAPSEPSDLPPASAEKIELMRERVPVFQAFHPLERRLAHLDQADVELVVRRHRNGKFQAVGIQSRTAA